MNAKLEIKGLDELRAALKKLPADLQREAAVIVQAQAEQMAVDVQGQYPSVTGNLRSHVRVVVASDVVGGISARVLNTAKHSHLYERGTKARQYSGSGPGKKMPAGWKAGKSTGQMPAKATFIPIAILRRRVMTAALVDVVERAGLTVTTSTA
jgi:Bacteriophage HK97-gp10, putative tail-component